MSALNEILKQLVADACTHPPGGSARQRCIQEIYRQVMKSGKLWKENTPYYEDALQETWEYCCQPEGVTSSSKAWLTLHFRPQASRR